MDKGRLEKRIEVKNNKNFYDACQPDLNFYCPNRPDLNFYDTHHPNLDFYNPNRNF